MLYWWLRVWATAKKEATAAIIKMGKISMKQVQGKFKSLVVGVLGLSCRYTSKWRVSYWYESSVGGRKTGLEKCVSTSLAPAGVWSYAASHLACVLSDAFSKPCSAHLPACLQIRGCIFPGCIFAAILWLPAPGLNFPGLRAAEAPSVHSAASPLLASVHLRCSRSSRLWGPWLVLSPSGVNYSPSTPITFLPEPNPTCLPAVC